jgi:hypothetical protein
MSASQLNLTSTTKTRSAIRIAHMAALNHVTQVIIANSNITKTLREDDQLVEDLTYLDPDPNNPMLQERGDWPHQIIHPLCTLP